MNLQRIWWTLGVLLVIAAAFVCLMPMPELPQSFAWNDKVSHMIGHGALALWFAGLVPVRGWWKIFVFLLLFGIAVEVAQYYLPINRNGDPRDVLANSAGAALGLALGWLGLARWPELAAWVLRRRLAQ
jgi:VanZ family protein